MKMVATYAGKDGKFVYGQKYLITVYFKEDITVNATGGAKAKYETHGEFFSHWCNVSQTGLENAKA